MKPAVRWQLKQLRPVTLHKEREHTARLHRKVVQRSELRLLEVNRPPVYLQQPATVYQHQRPRLLRHRQPVMEVMRQPTLLQALQLEPPETDARDYLAADQDSTPGTTRQLV